MTHDPLCPMLQCNYDGGTEWKCWVDMECDHFCECDLIVKVRKDERQQAAKRCMYAVTHTDADHELWVRLQDAIAAINGEQP